MSVLETGLRPKVLATNNKFTNVVVPFLAVTDKQTNITQKKPTREKSID